MANPAELVIRPVDRWQQGHRAPGFVFGVVKKFGDDRGGTLAALITFYGFLSLFPLMLVGFTILGFLAGNNAHLYQQVQDSGLKDFPVIGDQLKNNVHGLHGSTFGLVAGLVGLLWGSLGVAQAVQFAVNEAWDVPNVSRPNFFVRLARGLGFFGVLGLGVVGTTALTVLGGLLGHSMLAGAIGIAAALVVNAALFLGIFNLLGPKQVSWRDHVPGALVAGVGWQILQVAGTLLVQRNLKHTTALYGQFATVLGLISFLSLAAQLIMYSVELNVVRFKKLWPRSILQPPLLAADRKALDLRVTQEERRPEQRVEAGWTDR
jgi:inner membrane protein YhjD